MISRHDIDLHRLGCNDSDLLNNAPKPFGSASDVMVRTYGFLDFYCTTSKLLWTGRLKGTQVEETSSMPTSRMPLY